jgi:uncharacterized protein DUF4136
MSNLKFSFAFLLALFLTSQVKAQKVSTDFDPKANFSDYKTFMWIGHPRVKEDPLMEQRIVDAVSAALVAKAWQQVTEGADVGVMAHVATEREHTLETFYSGFGGGWGWRHWGGGLGEAITTPETYTVGTLVVDLFDGHTQQLIWRGMATDTLSDKPQKDTEKLNKAVAKMFKDFPPRGKY